MKSLVKFKAIQHKKVFLNYMQEHKHNKFSQANLAQNFTIQVGAVDECETYNFG